MLLAIWHGREILAAVNYRIALACGRPYLWATEFENVHSLWRYKEPPITIDGRTYRWSEDFYRAQWEAVFVFRRRVE